MDIFLYFVKGVCVMLKFMVLFFSMGSLFASDVLIPEYTVIKELLKPYSVAEKASINRDLSNIRGLIFSNAKKTKTPTYLATAGAPGARKSSILENYYLTDSLFAGFAYIDPDARALFLMIHTYLSQGINYGTLSKFNDFSEAKKSAYEKWRNASNYIANTLLNEAFKKRISIAHGTTSTGPHVEQNLKILKKNNYRIQYILCGASDQTRQDLIKYRNNTQGNYQSTPEDALNKGALFPKQIPMYFKYADELDLHWSESLKDDFSSVAIVNINKKEIQIKNSVKYQKFTTYIDDTSDIKWSDLIRNFKIKNN
jgi:hypothetical protein